MDIDQTIREMAIAAKRGGRAELLHSFRRRHAVVERRFDHARRDGIHADRRRKFLSQPAREHVYSSLGSSIDGSGRGTVAHGNRSQIDDARVFTLLQQRNAKR